MSFRINIFIVILSTFFNSCNSDSFEVIKDSTSLSFYFKGSNIKQKEIKFNNEGKIMEIKTFQDGKLHTQWLPEHLDLSDSFEYYGNGQIKTKGYFKDGKKHSLWSYFDRTGQLLIHRYFSYGKPSNIWIWYSHDEHHSINHYEIYEDFRDDGDLTRYYQSGNIKEKKKYFQNKLNGDYLLFYNDSNQSIHLKGKYFSGKKIDKWTIFDMNGISQILGH